MSIARRLFAAAALLAFLPLQAMAQGQPLIALGPCASGYVPVCAVKKNHLVTFINSCAARSFGARVIRNEPCPEGCPSKYAPVCAVSATGKRMTYGNVCAAERDGAKIVRNRGCQGILGRR